MEESPDQIRMTWFFWLLLGVEIVSAAVCFWGLKRLYHYIRRYRFDESVYTLPFGFMHLRYFVYFYVTTVLLAGATGFIFVLSLLNHDLAA
ncbi:MAG: hypothetical protein WC924_03120 [Candidatus Gracilibacteria bacterium]